MSQAEFENHISVITGAGRGLGRAYALYLAERGARVIVNDPGGSLVGDNSEEKPADSVVNEIKTLGGEAIANTDSVASEQGGKAIIEAALDNYGRIDSLIHNAGIVRYASLSEMSYEDFNAVLDVHLRGAFHVLRPAFPRMCEAGFGRIVLTSSIGGLYGNQRVGNYAAAKAGMIGLCNVAALEGAEHNVKCNVLVPGAVTRMAEGIDTSAYPPMQPELVAPLAAWLAHQRCSVNGEMLISIAGRIARAFIGESEGVYRPEWNLDAIDAEIDNIRNTDAPWILPVATAHVDHIKQSFAMAMGPNSTD